MNVHDDGVDERQEIIERLQGVLIHQRQRTHHGQPCRAFLVKRNREGGLS